MFRSANDVVAGEASVMEAGHLSDIVGQVRTVVGSAHLIRTSGVNAQIYVGISVYQGDVVVTGDDSSVGILFADGTAFNLASSSHLVLDEFVCDPDGSLKSGLLSVLQGAFSFIAGSKKQSSRLSIRTPFSTVRSAGRGAGIGTLTLAAFTFAIIKELQALPQDAAFLDYDLIPYDDLAGGAFTVTTKDPNPRTFIVDNPGVTLVIRGGSGSTFIAEQSANSALRMAELQAASREAFAIFSQGQLDPITGGWRKAALGSGGSGDATGNTLLLYDYTQNNVGVFTPTALTLKGFEPGGAHQLFQTPVQKLSIDKLSLGETVGVTGSSTLITASGELTFSGQLIGNGVISASFVSAAWAGGSLPNGLASILGSAVSALSSGVDSVGVSFSIVDKNLDFLAAGETVTLTYNVTINNGQATTPFVIEIVGANDQPTVAVGIGDSVSKSLTDGNAALTAGGTITVNDIDLSDQLTPVVSDVVLTGTIGNLTKGDVLGLLTVGPGFIAANPGDSNNLNWAFNSSAQTFDQLADGKILTLTYIITAFDNHGGAVNQLVSITVTGTNDGPLLSDTTNPPAVLELLDASAQNLAPIAGNFSV
ncbi:MAG: VCBS domain-containing protein, partial [Tardiphaga sp.]